MAIAKQVLLLLLGLGLLGVGELAAQSRGTTPNEPGGHCSKRLKVLDAKQKKALTKQLRALFKSDRHGDERKKLLGQLKAMPPIDGAIAQGLIKSCFRIASVGERFTKWGSQFQFKFRDRTTTIYTRGGGSRSKPKLLWIGLHGGGLNIGSGQTARGAWGSGGSKGVGIYPTCLRDVNWNDRLSHDFIQHLIATACRTWKIDTNRIYMSGHSMGGFGTWQNGCLFADRFAAISPNASGGGEKGMPKNLYNTPIWFFHSTDDPKVGAGGDQMMGRHLKKLKKEHPNGYDYVWKEYHDIGHGFPKDGLQPIISWMLKKERNPYPKKLIWEQSDYSHRRFAWLWTDEVENGRIIIAEFTEPNCLNIKTEELQEESPITVLFSKELIDFNKKVKITLNDEVVYNDYVCHSVWAIAQSILRNDPKQVFTGHVALKAK